MKREEIKTKLDLERAVIIHLAKLTAIEKAIAVAETEEEKEKFEKLYVEELNNFLK